MKFRTEINPGNSEWRIGYKTPVLLIGSCFSENMGEKFQRLLFPVGINPFGVVYNPMSVLRSLEIIIDKKIFREEDLFQFNELWHSRDHHSSFSHPEKDQVLKRINSEIESAHKLLHSASYLIITFGTARVYRLKETGEIVCNCHKVPANKFDQELLQPSDIVNSYRLLMSRLRAFNPGLKIIFTISPVRHWKDGPQGNQVSKSVLHLAIHDLLKPDGTDSEYFPAYEIVMDDLRDYRYYGDDLLHPNRQAIEYIWEKFTDRYFSRETLELAGEIDKLNRAAGHRMSNPDIQLSRDFKKAGLQQLNELQMKHPYLKLDRLFKEFQS